MLKVCSSEGKYFLLTEKICWFYNYFLLTKKSTNNQEADDSGSSIRDGGSGTPGTDIIIYPNSMADIDTLGSYKEAMKRAFPYTIPVLTGYLFIGLAFGVMFADKGYNVLWAILMSVLVYAGSGQYLAVNFFVPGFSILQAVFLTLMVNIRHVFYGLSLVERYNRFSSKRWYLIFGMTDETYSLICTTKVPEDVDEEKFLLSITLLNQLYWILGSIIGAVIAGTLPFNSEGIEFAMTALFIVMFVELWCHRNNRLPELIGVTVSLVCLLVFGADNFVLPTMLLIIAVIMLGKKRIEGQEAAKDA